ncbi:MAG: HYR domain-containing protein [Acidobacteria bacterium]|nr:HYR domain-containing protein [Acidobacteriota bacterium]
MTSQIRFFSLMTFVAVFLTLCLTVSPRRTSVSAAHAQQRDKTKVEKPAPMTKPAKPNRRSSQGNAELAVPCAERVTVEERRACRRWTRLMAAEEWDYAVRAFPNGIPPGARIKALEQVKKMEAAAAIRQLALSPASANSRLGFGTGAGITAGNIIDPSVIEGDTWFPIGPAPMNGFFAGGVSGRATAIAVNPSNQDDIYLGTSNGGVWHTTDGGLNWLPLTDDQPSLAIGSLAVSACSASGCNRIYAGTGENSLRRDTYYGAGVLIFVNEGEFPQWVPSGIAQFKFGSINNLIIDPTSMDQRIYVAFTSGVTASATESTMTAPEPPSGYGVYITENSGSMWTKLTVPGAEMTRPTDLEMDPQDSNTLFAGFLGKGIFKGVRNPATGVINWCPLNPGVTAAGCPAISCPGGATNCLPNPTSDPFDFVEISIHHPSAVTPAVLYALFGKCTDPIRTSCSSPLYKSTDGGASWTRINNGLPAGYSRYTRVLAIHPNDPNTVFYGGIRLSKSIDGGMSFTIAADTLAGGLSTSGTNRLHDDHHVVLFHPANPMRMYNASDGGFATSLDGGATWIPRNDDLQTAGFQSIASSILPTAGKVIGGAQDNGVSIWNGSRAWNFTFDGDGGATIMDADNDLTMYVTRQDITPNISTTGGSTWNFITGAALDVNDKHAFYPPFIQDRTSAHALYIGAQALYKSTNKGANWTRISPIAPPLGGNVFYPDINTENVITAIAVAPNNANRVYIGYYDGQVFASNSSGPCDSAACWTAVGGAAHGLPSAVVTRIAVDPTNANIAYLTFSGFGIGSHVFKTTSGGTSWAAINGSGADTLPDIPANTISIEPSAAGNLWLGTDAGIFKSTNGGASWTPFNKGLPRVAVYEISIDEIHGRVYAATHGRGAFVLTKPFLSNFEGWVGNQIWDIPVHGHGFLPNRMCKLQIVRQDGTICAESTKDAMNGDIETDGTGQLVTSRGSFYSGKPVAWACYNGNCVNNTPINSCNSTGNPVTSVLVVCDGLIGIDKILGCPSQVNPPDSLMGLSGLPGGPTPFAPDPVAPSLRSAVPSSGTLDFIASVQTRDGGTHALCSAPVNFHSSDSALDVITRAKDALNASPACVAQNVSARLANNSGGGDDEDEDHFFEDPKLGLSAPTVVGGQLIPSFHARPGNATDLCFKLSGLGIPVRNILQVARMKFETATTGAAGGTITVVERSDLGTCSVTVPTTPGATSAQIASAVFNAFQSPGIPGTNVLCPSRRNPRDVMLDGDSIITVMPSEVSVCIRDAGVGVFVGPKELLMQIADLSLTASAAPNTVVTGSNVTYTITLTNRGANAASNVVVRSNLPATTTFVGCSGGGGICGGTGNNPTVTFASLAPNASATMTLTATINCNVANAVTIANLISVSSDTLDSDLGNNAAQVTVQASNPPPMLTCPANVAAVVARPGDTSVVVMYSEPTVNDNCPGATVNCSPPSGASFPSGVTTVNCTVTDAGGATASCSFKVTVFDVCLQDDQSKDVLLFNSLTGDFQFTRCGVGGFTIEGRGAINRVGCLTMLTDPRVTATVDRCVIAPAFRGNARIKPNPVGAEFFIRDADSRNNTCRCP